MLPDFCAVRWRGHHESCEFFRTYGNRFDPVFDWSPVRVPALTFLQWFRSLLTRGEQFALLAITFSLHNTKG